MAKEIFDCAFCVWSHLNFYVFEMWLEDKVSHAWVLTDRFLVMSLFFTEANPIIIPVKNDRCLKENESPE